MAAVTESLLAFNSALVSTAEIPVSTEAPTHVHPFGTPTFGLLHLAGPEDGAGFVAIWTADRDGFDYQPIPEPEAAFVLEGVLRLTPTGGESVDVSAGQGYRLPEGWQGRIEAIEPVKKVYFLL
ncbi:cupin domain-containing protein [Herbiconiux daphne]|uniref:Cupin domain-containing protein n=1 Tax=Herbiconiux daphne TaxID=2970914 RepID=A0ABT2H6Y4_9MICO|nr:cupin domain-containing protein [Herbiconiux daphne]MCS5735689.1 cupin domain-containing protein [Herbiconiux daphne]